MNEFAYIREKFAGAVYLLATGTGSIQERLYSAWSNEFNTVNGDKLPQELQEDFDAIHRVLHAKDGPDGLGKVPEALRALDDEDASSLAAAICNFSSRLDTYAEDHRQE